MRLHMMHRKAPRPSLRELAAAAGVTVPTLRHYFGPRPKVVEAIFEECLRLGRDGLDAQGRSDRPFEESIEDYTRALIGALRAEHDVKLGDIFAVSLGEGLLDPGVSASTLRFIIDPTVDTLENRLGDHIARGEMIETDARAAALMLISPLLLAFLHQEQMCGASTRPLSLDALAETLAAAFVRAYATPPASAAI